MQWPSLVLLSFGDGHFTRVPDASHSYSSQVLLPLPCVSAIDLMMKINTYQSIYLDEEGLMASWEEEETEGIRAVGMRILRKTKPDSISSQLYMEWEFGLVFPDASHSYCS